MKSLTKCHNLLLFQRCWPTTFQFLSTGPPKWETEKAEAATQKAEKQKKQKKHASETTFCFFGPASLRCKAPLRMATQLAKFDKM